MKTIPIIDPETIMDKVYHPIIFKAKKKNYCIICVFKPPPELSPNAERQNVNAVVKILR